MSVSSPVLPDLGVAPRGVCARWLGDHPCGQPAVLHVLWDDDGSNGPVCDSHAVEATERWKPVGTHPYGPHCGRTGALWNDLADGCLLPFTAPDLGCARCGVCCEEIWIPYTSVEEVRAKLGEASDERSRTDLTFILEHWTMIAGPGSGGRWKWACDQYDAAHHLCGAHDGRPPICRDFPWYGRDPGDGGSIHTNCSYWLDVPSGRRPEGSRPLIPVTVVTR